MFSIISMLFFLMKFNVMRVMVKLGMVFVFGSGIMIEVENMRMKMLSICFVGLIVRNVKCGLLKILN